MNSVFALNLILVLRMRNNNPCQTTAPVGTLRHSVLQESSLWLPSSGVPTRWSPHLIGYLWYPAITTVLRSTKLPPCTKSKCSLQREKVNAAYHTRARALIAYLLDLLFLKLDHPLEPVDRCCACQQPRQLRVCSHVRLRCKYHVMVQSMSSVG